MFLIRGLRVSQFLMRTNLRPNMTMPRVTGLNRQKSEWFQMSRIIENLSINLIHSRKNIPEYLSKYARRYFSPVGSFQNETGIEGNGWTQTNSPLSPSNGFPEHRGRDDEQRKHFLHDWTFFWPTFNGHCQMRRLNFASMNTQCWINTSEAWTGCHRRRSAWKSRTELFSTSLHDISSARDWTEKYIRFDVRIDVFEHSTM